MAATMTIETLKAMAETIVELEGVMSANVWTKVPGRERLYIELTKHNGGRNWNGGCGLKAYISAADGALYYDSGAWAGAATRKHHESIGTLDAILAIRDAHRAPAEVEAALAAE